MPTAGAPEKKYSRVPEDTSSPRGAFVGEAADEDHGGQWSTPRLPRRSTGVPPAVGRLLVKNTFLDLQAESPEVSEGEGSVTSAPGGWPTILRFPVDPAGRPASTRASSGSLHAVQTSSSCRRSGHLQRRRAPAEPRIAAAPRVTEQRHGQQEQQNLSDAARQEHFEGEHVAADDATSAIVTESVLRLREGIRRIWQEHLPHAMDIEIQGVDELIDTVLDLVAEGRADELDRLVGNTGH